MWYSLGFVIYKVKFLHFSLVWFFLFTKYVFNLNTIVITTLQS